MPSMHAEVIRKHLAEEKLYEYFRRAYLEVLAPLCGARREDDSDFVHNVMDLEYPATEWRFQGNLG